MAGTAGFEPANGGVKVPCLAAWLRPKVSLGRMELFNINNALRLQQRITLIYGVSDGSRTHGLQSHNLTL